LSKNNLDDKIASLKDEKLGSLKVLETNEINEKDEDEFELRSEDFGQLHENSIYLKPRESDDCDIDILNELCKLNKKYGDQLVYQPSLTKNKHRLVEVMQNSSKGNEDSRGEIESPNIGRSREITREKAPSSYFLRVPYKA